MFAASHKVLRWSSGRAVTLLGSCPGDFTAIARALEATRELLAFHEAHQRVEAEIVIPALEARRPGASVRIADAHDDHALALRALAQQIATVEREGAPPRALHALYLAVTRFVAESFEHMYDEEMLVGPVLEEAYTAEEIGQLAARSHAVLTDDEKKQLALASLPAMSASERAQLR